MPTYLYRCQDCRFAMHLNCPVDKRDDPATCPCGGDLKREFTPCAIRMPAPDWASFTHKDILAPHNHEKKVWAVTKD